MKIHYAIIEDPNSIFGSVGRCGSGYNTTWVDWSEQGRKNFKLINDEWYQKYDEVTGHYTHLEESIIAQGFRNPLVITCGNPVIRDNRNFPSEFNMLPPNKKLILEGYDGGSRLWVAQKHNLPVPCIINDQTGRFSGCTPILNKMELKDYFTDNPEYVMFNLRTGATVTKLKHSHLTNKYANPENQAARIVPLWIDLLEKYGYEPKVRRVHKKYLRADQMKFLEKSGTGLSEKNMTNFKMVKKKQAAEKKRRQSLAKPKPVGDHLALDDALSFANNTSSAIFVTNKVLDLEDFIGIPISKTFLLSGTPFEKFKGSRDKKKFYSNCLSNTRVLLKNGMDGTTFIDGTDAGWINKLRDENIKLDLIVIEYTPSLSTMKYYLNSLQSFTHDETTIIVESSSSEKRRYFMLKDAGALQDLARLMFNNEPAKPEKNIPKPKKKIVPVKPRVSKSNDNGPSSLDEINASEWGEEAYVVGGGYSLKDFDWNKLDSSKFVVAINKAHLVLPDAQMVYFTDEHYWKEDKVSLLNHKGILVRGVLNVNKTEKHERVKLIHLTGPKGLETKPNCARHGLNSTYAVINILASQLKFKRIYLMGIDMQWGGDKDKSKTHWHQGYRRTTPQMTYRRMIDNFKTIVKPLNSIRVEVINVINPDSPSALEIFETKTLNEIFYRG